MDTEKGDIVIYQAETGATALEVHLDHDTVWLTQKQLADLFDVKVPAISKHVRNIVFSGELAAEATVSKMERVRREGGRTVSRTEVAYNLDMIISIGYRVNSDKATRFRIWAHSGLTSGGTWEIFLIRITSLRKSLWLCLPPPLCLSLWSVRRLPQVDSCCRS